MRHYTLLPSKKLCRQTGTGKQTNRYRRTDSSVKVIAWDSLLPCKFIFPSIIFLLFFIQPIDFIDIFAALNLELYAWPWISRKCFDYLNTILKKNKGDTPEKVHPPCYESFFLSSLLVYLLLDWKERFRSIWLCFVRSPHLRLSSESAHRPCPCSCIRQYLEDSSKCWILPS